MAILLLDFNISKLLWHVGKALNLGTRIGAGIEM